MAFHEPSADARTSAPLANGRRADLANTKKSCHHHHQHKRGEVGHYLSSCYVVGTSREKWMSEWSELRLWGLFRAALNQLKWVCEFLRRRPTLWVFKGKANIKITVLEKTAKFWKKLCPKMWFLV
jgi:hypothetical protein